MGDGQAIKKKMIFIVSYYDTYDKLVFFRRRRSKSVRVESRGGGVSTYWPWPDNHDYDYDYGGRNLLLLLILKMLDDAVNDVGRKR